MPSEFGRRVGLGLAHEVKDLPLATLRRQFGESRELLGSHLRRRRAPDRVDGHRAETERDDRAGTRGRRDANGRLTVRGDVPLLAQASQAAGVTPDALALAAVLAGAVGLEPADELIERLGAIGEDRPAYWKTRASLQGN